ncbi:MAG: hypothetical protein ACUVV0_17005 [Anaerolineae bacterium]
MERRKDFVDKITMALLGGFVALTLLLLFAAGSAAQEATPPAEENPASTPGAEGPEETSTPAALTLDDFVFGEPEVVLTHTHAIEIAGWLPDSERLLIIRSDYPNSTKEFVDIFNIYTGQLRHFGKRESSRSKPIWLPSLQAVAYADTATAEFDKLRISFGESKQELRIEGLSSLQIAVDSTGRRVIYFSQAAKKRLQMFDVTRETMQASLVDLALREKPDEERPFVYKIASHPKEAKVAIYNNYHFFLADLDTGTIQEIDLGTHLDGKLWAYNAEWSPDGRYLAMITTVGPPILPFTHLTVLDTGSGELRQIDLGLQYVADVAWAPDSRHVVVRAVVDQEDGYNRYGLFLADVVTGEIRRVLPSDVFSGGEWGWGLAWSPDGQWLITNCSNRTEGRICMAAVTVP